MYSQSPRTLLLLVVVFSILLVASSGIGTAQNTSAGDAVVNHTLDSGELVEFEVETGVGGTAVLLLEREQDDSDATVAVTDESGSGTVQVGVNTAETDENAFFAAEDDAVDVLDANIRFLPGTYDVIAADEHLATLTVEPRGVQSVRLFRGEPGLDRELNSPESVQAAKDEDRLVNQSADDLRKKPSVQLNREEEILIRENETLLVEIAAAGIEGFVHSTDGNAQPDLFRERTSVGFNESTADTAVFNFYGYQTQYSGSPGLPLQYFDPLTEDSTVVFDSKNDTVYIAIDTGELTMETFEEFDRPAAYRFDYRYDIHFEHHCPEEEYCEASSENSSATVDEIEPEAEFVTIEEDGGDEDVLKLTATTTLPPWETVTVTAGNETAEVSPEIVDGVTTIHETFEVAQTPDAASIEYDGSTMATVTIDETTLETPNPTSTDERTPEETRVSDETGTTDERTPEDDTDETEESVPSFGLLGIVIVALLVSVGLRRALRRRSFAER